MKKISIIIPTYNRKDLVIGTVQSLAYQTFQNFEIIVIDDGSTDRTGSKIKDMNLPNLKYLYQERGGVSIARNAGIAQATGQYICFLDSDDSYRIDFLENMIQQIEKENADLCFCGYTKKQEGVEKIEKSRFIIKDAAYYYLADQNKISTNAWLIRTSYLKKLAINFPEHIPWGEDILFFAKLLLYTEKVTCVKKYLAVVQPMAIERLSDSSIDKMDWDYEGMMKLLKEDKVQKNKKLQNIILKYRLQALLQYRLLASVHYEEEDKVLSYYEKYKHCLSENSFINGLRSIKLFLAKCKWKTYMRTLKKS